MRPPRGRVGSDAGAVPSGGPIGRGVFEDGWQCGTALGTRYWRLVPGGLVQEPPLEGTKGHFRVVESWAARRHLSFGEEGAMLG